MMHYTCKYAPTELFAGFGVECMPLDEAPDNFELAETVVHPNVCGFGKAVIQAVMAGNVDELVLVNCCDTMLRTYEVIKATGLCRFVYLMDLPHCESSCAHDQLAHSLRDLRDAYAAYSEKPFDRAACVRAFARQVPEEGPYVGIMGVRANARLAKAVEAAVPLPVRNLTCLGLRTVSPIR